MNLQQYSITLEKYIPDDESFPYFVCYYESENKSTGEIYSGLGVVVGVTLNTAYMKLYPGELPRRYSVLDLRTKSERRVYVEASKFKDVLIPLWDE